MGELQQGGLAKVGNEIQGYTSYWSSKMGNIAKPFGN
jgi:hypothetical protein